MSQNALFLARLTAMKHGRQPQRAAVAGYLLAHWAQLDACTITSAAEETHTSYATVCRVLKDVGVTGFRELKQAARSEPAADARIEQQLDACDLDSAEPLAPVDIRRRICDFSASVAAHCFDAVKPETAAAVVQALRDARMIYFAGMGTSAVTARYAYTKLFRLNPNCAFDSDVILAKMRAAMLQKGDVLFVISSSGRTKPMIETAALAKRAGATVIALCDFVQSPLTALADLAICTTVRDSNKYVDMDFPLIQGQITIIDVVYACLYREAQRVSSHKFRKTVAAVQAEKDGADVK